MYLEIFSEIIAIFHEDYAGCLDKKGWDHPDVYLNQIKRIKDRNEMNDDKFVEIVKDYMLDFKDLHMVFRCTGQTNQDHYVGFTVRRYKDSLFVITSDKEMRLKTGDVITAVNDKSILGLVKTHSRQLMESVAERENWNAILSQYNYIEVDNGIDPPFKLELKKYERPPYQPEYSIKEIEEGTLLLKLTDFMDQNAISNLIHNHHDQLTNFKQLIIDVRFNKGGYDMAYFNLLPYLFDGEEIDLDSFNEGVTMLTNCTNRNVELRIQMINTILASVEDDQSKDQLNAYIHSLLENKGKGFVELDLGEKENESHYLLKTKKGPEKVILLTDVYCGSSGDAFVETCKYSSKVTVIGRPTLGLNDYANLATMVWENKFELMYPTSKLSIVDEGKGMSGIGIKPDIYIPWTPDHIKEDIDLKRALDL